MSQCSWCYDPSWKIKQRYPMNQIHLSQWSCKFFHWITLLDLGYSGFLCLDLLVLVTVACPVSDHITTSCAVTRQSKSYTPPIDYRNNCAFQQIKHRATDINPASIQQKYFFNLRWDRIINNLQGVMTLYYLSNISGGEGLESVVWVIPLWDL